jgi:NADH:ubiquinone oxidoreductase subunit H
MCCYVRTVLPRVRLVSLVRLCYVFLLPCYLGGIVIVQPSLPIKIVAYFAHKKTPPNNLEFSK